MATAKKEKETAVPPRPQPKVPKIPLFGQVQVSRRYRSRMDCHFL